MINYTEKGLPKGWFLDVTRDVAGARVWVIRDREDGEPQVAEFTKQKALKSAIEYAREKGLLPKGDDHEAT